MQSEDEVSQLSVTASFPPKKAEAKVFYMPDYAVFNDSKCIGIPAGILCDIDGY